MYDITELKDFGQCKYPLTDEPPHFFCGEPTVELACSYCLRHAALCYGGAGKNWVALYEMMKAQEQTVHYTQHARHRDTTPTMVEVLNGGTENGNGQGVVAGKRKHAMVGRTV